MLTALLLAGLVTAVATPVYVMMATGEEEEDLSDDLDAPGTDVGDILEAASQGVAYSVPAAPGSVTLNSFVPGSDTVLLHVPSDETEFVVLDHPNSGVSLHYDVAGEGAELHFPGLESLPDSDIRIVFPDDDAAPASLATLETDATEEGDSGPQRALPPYGSPVLDATVSVAPQDDPEGDSQIAITEAAHGVVEVSGFVPGQDTLQVNLETDLEPEAVEMSFSPSFDGEDGLLIANSKLIAVLPGVPDVGLEDVEVSVTPPAAA